MIADTTYILVQKSSNNQMQRKSYSLHKHRNLVKLMILTTTVSLSSVCQKVVDYILFCHSLAYKLSYIRFFL